MKCVIFFFWWFVSHFNDWNILDISTTKVVNYSTNQPVEYIVESICRGFEAYSLDFD